MIKALEGPCFTCRSSTLLTPCWFHGSSFKGFLIVFLFPDWLKLNRLKSRMGRGFSDIFSRHFCSTLAETIGLTNYAATFEAAEMILGRWNQQLQPTASKHSKLPGVM